jgi:hypothetical protein
MSRGNTRSPSSSSATASPPRPSPSPIWCCRIPAIWSATMRSPCSTARSPSSTARSMRCASRCCRRKATPKPFQDVLIELGSRLKLPAFVDAEGKRKFRDYPGLHRQLRDLARLRHRLSGRLARQGRRQGAQGRAQPEAVGDVRQERLRLPSRAAPELPVHAQLEQGLSALGARARHDPLCRAHHHPSLFRGPAEVPVGRAGQVARTPAAGSVARARRDLLRPIALLPSPAGRPNGRHGALSV